MTVYILFRSFNVQESKRKNGFSSNVGSLTKPR